MHSSKSHVTRSLADGHARYSIQRVSDRVDTVSARVRKAIARYSTLPTRKANGRRLMKLIHKQFAPISLASIGAEGARGSQMLAVLLPAVKDKQLHVFGLIISLSKMGVFNVESRHVATITAHALGRVWQRTELADLKWEDVRITLGFPLMFLWPTLKTAQHHKFERMALPCFDGLLLGKREHGALVLTTFITPPMSGKWQDVRAVYDDVLQHTSQLAAQSEANVEAVTVMYKGAATGLMTPGVEQMIDGLAGRMAGPEFNWMKLVYNDEESDGTYN